MSPATDRSNSDSRDTERGGEGGRRTFIVFSKQKDKWICSETVVDELKIGVFGIRFEFPVLKRSSSFIETKEVVVTKLLVQKSSFHVD